MDIDALFEKLSWDSSQEIQEEGLCEARKIKSLSIFLQPLEGKGTWDNCAKVLSEKDDLQLERYVFSLFEWLQDMNWPGALTIWERLARMPKDSLQFAYEYSLETARKTNDECWYANLIDFWKHKN